MPKESRSRLNQSRPEYVRDFHAFPYKNPPRTCSKYSRNLPKMFTEFYPEFIRSKNAHKDFLDDVPHLVVVSPGNGPKFIQDLA